MANTANTQPPLKLGNKPPLKLGNKPPLKLGNKPMIRKPLPSANSTNNNTRNNKHGVDLNNCAFGSGKVYSNAAPRKPKTYGNTVQQNGTKTLQYSNDTNKHNAIRGFDIGNNAKYAAAGQMARNTNALPSNFWEDESDTDSEEDRTETQQEIANRWRTQRTNIGDNLNMPDTPSDTPEDQMTFTVPKTANVYDADTSSEDDASDDGFATYVPPPKPQFTASVQNYKQKREEKQKEDFWKNNNTTWIVDQRNKRHHYDTMWFKVPKMRNAKANGAQMRPYLEQSGLSKEQLKQIWKLSDLDKDGKMGDEEFALCMFLIDEVKIGARLPDTLPQNYIPPSFRGKRLIKTPPRKPKPQPKSVPATMQLNNGPPVNKQLPQQNALPPVHKQMPEKKPFPARNAPSPANVNAKPMVKPRYNAPKTQYRQPQPQPQPQPFRPNQSSAAPAATNAMRGPSSSPYGTNTRQNKPLPAARKTAAPLVQSSSHSSPFGSGPTRNTMQAQSSSAHTNTMRGPSAPYGNNAMQRRSPAPTNTMQSKPNQSGNTVRNNNPQRGNKHHQGKAYPGNNSRNAQYQELSYDEMREQSVQAAKEAGKRAKKAGRAAMGWMAKKMNDLNDKVQENNQNNNAQNNQRRYQGTNANQRTYQK